MSFHHPINSEWLTISVGWDLDMAIYKHFLYLAGQANMLLPISILPNKTLIIKYMNGMGDGENNVNERDRGSLY